MSVVNLRLLPIAITVALLAGPIAAGQHRTATSGPTHEPKTVVDFFLLVPDRYMPYYDLAFRQGIARGERRGTVIDIPNGYLSWDASDNSEFFQVAIFRKSNGTHIVAYSVPYDDQFPGASAFVLLSYDHGRWRDVTKAMLPVRYKKTNTYALPQQGTTIVVRNENGETYSLDWKDDRFVLRK
jgi:hypothetical protein